jgi:hypothetical protein
VDCQSYWISVTGADSPDLLLPRGHPFHLRSLCTTTDPALLPKGKNSKGRIGDFSIEGDVNFQKNIIQILGVTSENYSVLDNINKEGKITLKTFDKSEVATSKLLLKTALSALYTSQKTIYEKYDFSDLRDFLLAKNNKNWPFITTDLQIEKFSSIPKQQDKHILTKLRCSLRFCELDNQTLLFKFKYGSIPMVINLINRNLIWIPKYLEKDTNATLYPEHFVKKLISS